MRHFKAGFRGLGLLAVALAAGCSAADGSGFEMDGQIASESDALSVRDVLCKALDNLDIVADALTTQCATRDATNLYYHGSFAPTGTLTDFSARPFITSAAYYCAVKDTHGAKNTAGVASTAFGGFGMSTRVAINKSDPYPNLNVEGQRIGAITLFGAEAELDIQEFGFKFKGEARPAGQVSAVRTGTGQTYTQNVSKQQGQYMEVTSRSMEWGVSGRIPIPTPIPGLRLGITPSLQHDHAKTGSKPLFNGMNNTLVSHKSVNTSQPNAPNAVFGWDASVQREAACRTGCQPGFLCNCIAPTAKEVAEHERVCSGAACDYSKLTDGVLPYDGPFGGATQSQLYHDNLPNWFHFGHPGKSAPWDVVVDPNVPTSHAEPIYDLLTGSAAGKTTKFSITVDAGYDFGVVDVNVDLITNVGMRSGFAVRQRRVDGAQRQGEFAVPEGQIQTAVDSQSEFDIKAKISVDFPIFGSWSDTITLLKPTGTSSSRETTAARVTYKQNEASKFTSYTSTRTGAQNPDAALSACLSASPAVTPSKPADPEAFLKKVTTESIKHVHPCRVTSCDAQDRKQSCDWNASTNSFSCTLTGGTCGNCPRLSASLCDENNVVLTNPDTGAPVTVAQTDLPRTCIIR